MRVELKDVDRRDMEAFLNDLLDLPMLDPGFSDRLVNLLADHGVIVSTWVDWDGSIKTMVK